jgi:hypothetical protein
MSEAATTDALAPSWEEANQRGLMAALDEVRHALERHAASLGGPPAAALDSAARSAAPEAYALDAVCRAFRLSPFERSVLLLCAGMELDSTFAGRCAAAQGDPRRAYPTFSLALAALPGAHWSALSPERPLRRYRLVELRTGEVLTQSPLRIDERVLHHLAGVPHLDERLEGVVEPVMPAEDLPTSHERAAERIAAAWRTAGPGAPWPVVQLTGSAAGSKRPLAAQACAVLGLHLHAMRAGHLPAGAAEQEALLRLWEREAVLGPSALFLDAEDAEGPERARLVPFVERMGGPALVAAHEPLASLRRPQLRLEVARPRPDEQRVLWQRHLGFRSPSLNGQVDRVVAHFNLDAEAIRSVCAASASAPEALWDACRAQARSHLDDLSRRIEATAGWDDLVLPEPQRQLLGAIAAQVRQRSRVYEEWGFGETGLRGLGIAALFAGPSGTGKTMAAEVLARELRLDLCCIDLSQVVSKYIGETEKNLRRVFDAAEGGGAILLFDEADALFGKRSEVRDSHDRYANIEVSYLLQRMEAYRGLAILTTNLKSALDQAFLRRLRFVVSFPFPDAAQREGIWRRVFPARTPTEGLDPARLARLGVTGGSIRNIALHAAFLAAESGTPVRMPHLLRAARDELAKLEKSLTEAEVEGWA